MIINAFVYWSRQDGAYVAECCEITNPAVDKTKRGVESDLLKILEQCVDLNKEDRQVVIFGNADPRTLARLRKAILKKKEPYKTGYVKKYNLEVHFYK